MKPGAGPVDLPRVRAGMAELRALLDADPTLAARAGAMLAGELPCPDLEAPLKHETQAAVRMPAELLARAERLVSLLAADPDLRAWGRVSRAAVLRLALVRGLEVLEKRAAKLNPAPDPEAGR